MEHRDLVLGCLWLLCVAAVGTLYAVSGAVLLQYLGVALAAVSIYYLTPAAVRYVEAYEDGSREPNEHAMYICSITVVCFGTMLTAQWYVGHMILTAALTFVIVGWVSVLTIWGDRLVLGEGGFR